MRALARLCNGLDRIISVVGRIGAWFGLVLILVTMFDVITRNLSQSSVDFLRDFSLWREQELITSTKLQELEWHFHTVLFMLCIGWVYVLNGHVRIELVTERFRAKVKSAIELIGLLVLMLPFMALLIWYTLDFTITSYQQHEISSSGAGLSHRWIIKAFLPIGFFFLFLAGISTVLRKLVVLFGGDEARGLLTTRFFVDSKPGAPTATPPAH